MGPDHLRAVSEHMMAGATDAEKYLLQELINYLADSKHRNEELNQKIDDGFARVEAHCSNRTVGCNGVMKTLEARVLGIEQAGLIDKAVREAIGDATKLELAQIAEEAVDRYFKRSRTVQIAGASAVGGGLIAAGAKLIADWLGK